MIHILNLAVCSLRLDFETFTTQGLSATTELAAITCQDTFIISVSYPVISLRKHIIQIIIYCSTNQYCTYILGKYHTSPSYHMR